MNEKRYPISFEISGPLAMFTRPDTGATPISYPAPTKSALKSIAESIIFSKSAYFEPLRVEICRPIIYHKYSTNYRGPLRKSGTSNFQYFATVLTDVCYKVYGHVESYDKVRGGVNHKHQYQEIFMRRLSQCLLFTTPFLGWKEFTPDYFGVLRPETSPDTSIQLTIASMLVSMYSRPTNGALDPVFAQNVEIRNGVLYYAE